MTDDSKKTGFERKIFPQDILAVLGDNELKTSEVITKLKESEKGKRVKKYNKITQDGVLKVLKKMRENKEIEGDIERFGFWMWKKKEQEK